MHAIGGTTKPVHLLLEPPPTISVEEMVLKIQATSAERINRHVDNFFLARRLWRMQHQQSPRWKGGEVHPTSGAVSCVDHL